MCDAFSRIPEIECVTAFVTEEVTVDSRLVPIIAANNFRPVRSRPNPERRLAAIAAVRANGGNVVHLPRPRLVAIGSAGQRAHRADIDTHPALLTVEVVEVVG